MKLRLFFKCNTVYTVGLLLGSREMCISAQRLCHRTFVNGPAKTNDLKVLKFRIIVYSRLDLMDIAIEAIFYHVLNFGITFIQVLDEYIQSINLTVV
jgi:hypothetical protein